MSKLEELNLCQKRVSISGSGGSAGSPLISEDSAGVGHIRCLSVIPVDLKKLLAELEQEG